MTACDSAAARAVEQVARATYGRLLAYIAARWRDVTAAEDALADAFAAALQTWPAQGVPDRPEAWLLTAARRRLVDQARHAKVRGAAATALFLLAEERDAPAVPDERLALLFVCAHPAIDPAIHTPLMLQCVLGLDAARIAAAFLVQPAAMGQRLARAKAKIRAAGIAFAIPEARELPARVGAVLQAIYAAFTAGWDGDSPLAEEAIFLGRVLCAQMPDTPEARGLLALMLLAAGRSPAGRDAAGRFVPLRDQDPARWDAARIAEGMVHLARAGEAGAPGRFQLEAAIQAVHCVRPTDWGEIALLYEGLIAVSPTVGVAVARAVAVGEALGAAHGLARLDEVGDAADYQPYWAARAHLLAAAGQDATSAARRAVELARDPAVREWLGRKYVLF